VNKKRALPSISSKLTVWFTVFALGMTLVTAVLVEDAATTALQARIGTSLGDLARHTTRELDRSLLGRYNDIRLLAAQPAIIDSGAPLAVRQRALEQVQSTSTLPGFALPMRAGRSSPPPMESLPVSMSRADPGGAMRRRENTWATCMRRFCWPGNCPLAPVNRGASSI
jgi:hypothetical protein